jgi:hypothetical protein
VCLLKIETPSPEDLFSSPAVPTYYIICYDEKGRHIITRNSLSSAPGKARGVEEESCRKLMGIAKDALPVWSELTRSPLYRTVEHLQGPDVPLEVASEAAVVVGADGWAPDAEITGKGTASLNQLER